MSTLVDKIMEQWDSSLYKDNKSLGYNKKSKAKKEINKLLENNNINNNKPMNLLIKSVLLNAGNIKSLQKSRDYYSHKLNQLEKDNDLRFEKLKHRLTLVDNLEFRIQELEDNSVVHEHQKEKEIKKLINRIKKLESLTRLINVPLERTETEEETKPKAFDAELYYNKRCWINNWTKKQVDDLDYHIRKKAKATDINLKRYLIKEQKEYLSKVHKDSLHDVNGSDGELILRTKAAETNKNEFNKNPIVSDYMISMCIGEINNNIYK